MLKALRKMWNNGHASYDVPPEGAILQEQIETSHTPDLWWLSCFAKQFVFIYDNNMSVFGNSQLEGTNEGVAYSKDEYVLYKKYLGEDAYPIAIKSNHKISRPPWADPIPGNPQAIKGELWLLTIPQIIELDNHFENGQAWFRKRISVRVPDRKKRVFDSKQSAYPMQDQPDYKEIRCWMYIGNPDVWKPLVAAGKLFNLTGLYKPNKVKPFDYYYYFSPTELNDE